VEINIKQDNRIPGRGLPTQLASDVGLVKATSKSR